MDRREVLKIFSVVLVVCLLAGCGGQAAPAGGVPTGEARPAGAGVLAEEDKQVLDDAAKAVESMLAKPLEAITIEEPAGEQPGVGEGSIVDTTPQEITVTTSDGVNLPATYYPSSSDPAPYLVVYYHWVGGNRLDFDETARWLQNVPKSSALGPVKVRMSPIHRDLPPLDPGLSVASFAADFRGCTEEGCNTMNAQGWLKDSLAVMEQAKKMKGIGPDTKIIAMGSSIGADAAAYACASIAGCSMVLPLSPGGYLGIPFETNLKKILSNQITTVCIGEAKSSCISFKSKGYTSIVPTEKGHGNSFFDEGRMALVEFFNQSLSNCSDENLAKLTAALEKARNDYKKKEEQAEFAKNVLSNYRTAMEGADAFIKNMNQQAGMDYSSIDSQAAQKLAENFDDAAEFMMGARAAMQMDDNPGGVIKKHAEEFDLAAKNVDVVRELFRKDLADGGNVSQEWEGKSGLAAYWMEKLNDLATLTYVLLNPSSGYLAALQTRVENLGLAAKLAKNDMDAAQKALDDYKAGCP